MQRKPRLPAHVVTWDELEPPLTRDGGDKKCLFQPTERRSDTGPRPEPERKVTPGRAAIGVRRLPALGPKALGFRIPARIALDDILGQEHLSSRFKPVPAELDVLDQAPYEGEDRRIEAQRLRHDHRAVLEPFDVRGGGQLSAED